MGKKKNRGGADQDESQSASSSHEPRPDPANTVAGDKPVQASLSPPCAATPKNVNAFVLQEVAKAWSSPSRKNTTSLAHISRTLGLDPLPPREKITVLLIGNHSAGKSSFVNWYVNDKVQRESAAMETSGFTFVVSGTKRETFRGEATIRHLPFLTGIEKFDGLMSNLTTEVSPSRVRDFPLVQFIDTPGLVDGTLAYKFDVNEVIAFLADRVDLIMVCLDPHGQMTVERTMQVVRRLHVKHADKLRYLLTKADSIPNERERLKVLSQLSQSLSRISAEAAVDKATGATSNDQRREFYGEHALEILCISIRDKDAAFNQLSDITLLFKKTIAAVVQKHISLVEQQCRVIMNKIESDRTEYDLACQRNRIIHAVRAFSFLFTFTVPLLFCCYLAHFFESALLPTRDPSKAMHVVRALAGVVTMIEGAGTSRFQLVGGLLVAFLIFVGVSKWIERYFVPVRDDEYVENLTKWKKQMARDMGPDGVIDRLWKLYLTDAAGDKK